MKNKETKILLTSASVLLVSSFLQSDVLAQDSRNIGDPPQDDRSEMRNSSSYQLTEIDSNNDGLLSESIDPIRPGDYIYYENNGNNSIESGYYLIPSNKTFVDFNGDRTLDLEPVFSRVVVVVNDNLTYLFDEQDTQRVIGIFPNGTGRAGSNSITSLRRVNAILGEDWGTEYSNNQGWDRNMFGIYTLATRFAIDENPENDIDTFQELHGTPPELDFLLGGTISGGCIRHSNQTIRILRNNLGIGDFVLTVQTAEDDIYDSQWNIHSRTLVAAGMAEQIVEIPEDAEIINDTQSRDLPANITQATWYPISIFPRYEDLFIGHPYTRAEYDILSCGLETYSASALFTQRELLIKNGDTYFLNNALTIRSYDGSSLEVSDFYIPTQVTIEELNENAYYFSSGDISTQALEYLTWDFAYQYALSLVRQTYPSANDLTLISDLDLRRTQLVTGLIPVNYFGHRIYNDNLASRFNRTLVEKLPNIFYGRTGEIYELDYRNDESQQLRSTTDSLLYMPSFDHDVVRTGETTSLIEVLNLGIQENRQIIFRITNNRLHTTNRSFEADLSPSHYYALMPDISNIELGYIAIYDSMHPSQVLVVPTNQVVEIFSTVIVLPR